MALTRTEVERIAHLARLHLSPAELDRYGAQLDAILGYVETLGKLDLAGVEPTAGVSDRTDRTRPDTPAASLTPDDLAAIAPEFRAGSVRVPKILEG